MRSPPISGSPRTARALKDAGAPGTLDQLRAAVFVALLAGRDPETLLPPSPGQHDQADGGSGPDRNPAGPAGAAGSGGPRPGGLAALTGTGHLAMPPAAW